MRNDLLLNYFGWPGRAEPFDGESRGESIRELFVCGEELRILLQG
jgi:hypothetical protein